MNEIIMEKLTAGYFGTEVLHDISLAVNDPGIYVVIGKNGAGKTTLFRTISGVLRPYEGKITIDGMSPYFEPAVRKRILFLSHADAIPEGFKVREIMKLFADIEDADYGRIGNIGNALEISDIMDSPFHSLSHGQKKRVSIAKCLLGEREIYILDEPTSDIDPKASTMIRSILSTISKEHVVFYSSHNLQEAREIGDKVIAINNGRAVYYGTVASLPAGKYVIGIRGSNVESVYPDARREGDFYIVELQRSDDVQKVIDKLGQAGAKIEEIRQMNNPLEELF